MEIEVDAAPVAAQAYGEGSGPASKTLPPQEDSSEAEEQEDGGADSIDLLAVGGVEEEEDVEVLTPLDLSARLEI